MCVAGPLTAAACAAASAADRTVLSGTLHPVDATTIQIDGQAVEVDQVVEVAIW